MLHKASVVLLLAAVSVVTGEDDQGQCVVHLQEEGAVKVDLQPPFNYTAANEACLEIDLIMLTFYDQLNVKERALCGDKPVPIGRPIDKYSDDYDYLDDPILEVNLKSNRTLNVSNDHEFNCLLCQQEHLYEPFKGIDDVGRFTKTHFQVYLISDDSKETKKVTESLRNAFSEELFRQFQPESNQSIQFHRSWLDDDQHLQIVFGVSNCLPDLLFTVNTEISVLNDSYTMRVEDVSFCPDDDTVDENGVATSWPMTLQGVTAFTKNAKTGRISGRACYFNKNAFSSDWDPLLTRWQLKWRPCKNYEDLYDNEQRFLPILGDDVKLRHENVLYQFTSEPVNYSTLQHISNLVYREYKLQNELQEQIRRDLAKITSMLELVTDFVVVSKLSTTLIIANLKGSDQFVGFTVEYIDEFYQFTNISLNSKSIVQGRAPFAFDISARLIDYHQRMAFVLVWKRPPEEKSCFANEKISLSVEVLAMFPFKGEVSAWGFASYGNYYIEMTYEDNTMENKSSYFCKAWNKHISKWVSRGCAMKNIKKNGYSTCRCSAKYFVLEDNIPIAKFIMKRGRPENVYTNSFVTNFLKDKIALMTATAIECLLSMLGLGSIICTAIFFKKWRENTGHKILLHMLFALTCNLGLGLVVNFVHMSVESVGCLVYGVLRHYSFLAMFLWMLVLSLLQLKRLLTVAGARATTHLILKVSVFAWGLPLVPIIILLSMSPGYYLADRFDRGYCYPEGIVFKVTVQGPAGLILIVNLGIFVVIVMHIFEFVGKKKITRHTKNQRAEQLNKLKTSLFMFFLFGFTWVFHILSEERVIVSDFLFEYLFLITATFHIFILSLFFVVLQESTRKDWITLIKNKVC